MSVRPNVSEELLSLFSTSLVTKESISSSAAGHRISADTRYFNSNWNESEQ